LLSSFALFLEEGAGKAGCRLAPMIRCAKTLHTQMRRRKNRWAGKHPAFPARWVDSLYALSPEPSSFWSPSPRELAMAPGPVEPRSISARLDRSNDGQDHALSPYAAHPASSRRTLQSVGAVRSAGSKDLTRFISPWSRLHLPGTAASTAPRPTFDTTYDRPSSRVGMRG